MIHNVESYGMDSIYIALSQTQWRYFAIIFYIFSCSSGAAGVRCLAHWHL